MVNLSNNKIANIKDKKVRRANTAYR